MIHVGRRRQNPIYINIKLRARAYIKNVIVLLYAARVEEQNCRAAAANRKQLYI